MNVDMVPAKDLVASERISARILRGDKRIKIALDSDTIRTLN